MATCNREGNGKLKRLDGESFLKFQLRQGWCAFMADSMSIEMQASTLVIGLGIWMAFVNIFDACPAGYWVMQSIMPHTMWGVLLSIIGGVQLFALLTNQFKLRKKMLLVQTMLWIFLICVLFYGNRQALSIPVFMILATSSIRGYFCLRKSQG